MKKLSRMFYSVLIAVAFAGCTTSENKEVQKEALTVREQKAALSRYKSPQHFGFSVFPVRQGIDFRGAARLKSDRLAVVKLLKGNIPAIEMRGSKSSDTMTVLLDFSSPTSWMEYLTAKEQGAVFLGMDDQVIPYRGGYFFDGIRAYAGVATQVWIDQLSMENVPFYIRMSKGALGMLARGIVDPPVEATLGYDNLRNFEYIKIDMPRKQIMFSSNIPYVPQDELLMATAKIIHLPGYGLVVEGAVSGQPAPVVLDFAGNYGFARGDVAVDSTKQVSLGDMVFRQVPTITLQSNASAPRAGRKIFEPYVIAICARKGVVYFERPPKPE